MESNIIKDRLLSTINRESDVRIRIIGRIDSIEEKIGTFVVSYGNDKVTCLPSISTVNVPKKGDTVTLVGRVVPTDNNEIEIRTEYMEKISEKDYDSYGKYLKIRDELLNNGS